MSELTLGAKPHFEPIQFRANVHAASKGEHRNATEQSNYANAYQHQRQVEKPSTATPQQVAEKDVVAKSAMVTEEEQTRQAEQAEQAVKVLNGPAQSYHNRLNFAVSDEKGDVVIKVIDSESEEVIREIPSKDVLKLMADNQEKRQGVLLQIQV